MTENTIFPALFKEANLGNITLRNRVVMLPMGTAYATPSGEVTEKTIEYYVERAKGGVGLITVGNISPGSPNALNQLVLSSDWVLMGQYELVEKVHAEGAKIVAQLNHTGRQKYPEAKTEEVLVSSSPIPSILLGTTFPTPVELNKRQMSKIIEAFAEAAKRAKMVGYDMIELHGAHGYLINQFLSPFMNKRLDQYGGSLENRMRFPLELIREVRRAVSLDFPVGFRISADEFMPGGITLNESPAIVKILEDSGVAYISVTGSVFESMERMEDLMRDPEGWKAYLWEGIKKAANIPVIAGGGLRHPEFCEDLIAKGKADFVGLARGLIADPEWPKKAYEGRHEDIRFCISCNECLFGSSARRRGGGARRCSINAAVGREREFSRIHRSRVSKRVLVIGGGPAGMETARIAAERRHQVILCEKEQALGGQLLLAGKISSKKKLLWLRDFLAGQLKKLDIEIRLGLTVTYEMIEDINPDAVVVACGVLPSLPEIPGINSGKVMSAWHILKGDIELRGKKVAVIGGGMIGSEIAEYLAEYQNEVVIIEELQEIASDMEPINRVGLMRALEDHKVVILNARRAIKISDKGVRMLNLENGKEENIEVEHVVAATGTKPLNSLYDSLKGRVKELYCIGDCKSPRVILEAIYEGSLVGRQI